MYSYSMYILYKYSYCILLGMIPIIICFYR
nr:MAG TPA: hypothetical protein [Caudoviricetes sp.]